MKRQFIGELAVGYKHVKSHSPLVMKEMQIKQDLTSFCLSDGQR